MYYLKVLSSGHYFIFSVFKKNCSDPNVNVNVNAEGGQEPEGDATGTSLIAAERDQEGRRIEQRSEGTTIIHKHVTPVWRRYH